MNADNYAERVNDAGRKIAHFIAGDETLQKMTQGEIKHALDSAYRDISAIFANMDLVQALSVISPSGPGGQESRPTSES